MAAERTHPISKVRGRDQRSHSAPEARVGSRKEQPHVQGKVASQTQEGLEEQSHSEGQEGRR